jgi:NADH:ubiquinone oxidoreductase subunit C
MNFLKNYDVNNNTIVYNSDFDNSNDSVLEDIHSKDNRAAQVISIISSRQDLKILAAFLKMHSLSRVSCAIDITVVDKINSELRFNINYQLLSTLINTRIIISTFVSEDGSVISLQSLYKAFNWSEREVWDMYGIFISKHPDLRRILTDYGFIGFPLRKDFPLSGFKEVQYEDSIKQVEYNNTELTQSYRLLSFSSNWY